MGGDSSGNDSTDDYSKMNPADRQNQGLYKAKNIFGQDEIRAPVFNNDGFQAGYTSNALPGLATAIGAMLNDGKTPQVYTGDSRYNPNADAIARSQGKVLQNFYSLDGTVEQRYVDPNGGDGGSSQQAADPFAQQRAELASARANRANALAAKQAELTSAFGEFSDDFYNDLSTSFSDYQNPLLTQGYDDSLRGIYDGFKAKGLLTQAGLDSAIGGLDTAKTAEAARISQGAADYAAARRADVIKRQQKLGDQLAAMVGGATTAADVNAQTDAINAFDFSGDVTKLKTPAAKGNLDFFQGFNKVAATASPQVDPQAVSSTGAVQSGSITPARLLTGIQSPYQGSSSKVIL